MVNNKMSTSTSGKKATTKSALRQHSSPAFFFRDQNLNDFEPSAEEQPLLGFCQGNGQSHPIRCLANIYCSKTTLPPAFTYQMLNGSKLNLKRQIKEREY